MINELRNKTYHFLRRTEKYTKTDMVYLASGGFWLSIKTVLSALIAIGLSIAFANLLPQHIFGEYKYVFSIFGLLAIPTLLGMGKSATRSVAQGYEETPIAVIKTKILWGILGSIASIAIASYYFLHDNASLAGAFALVAIFLPFVDTLSIFNSVLTGKKLFKISIIYEGVIYAASATVIALTLFLTNNLILILLSYFVAYTTTRLIALRLVVKKYVANNKVDPNAVKYGKHLSAMRILSTIAESIDGILLWQFVGATQLAIFAFAKAIPIQIRGALKKITVLAFPKFAERDFQSIKQPLIYKMLKLFLVMVIIVAVYIILAPYIYNTLFPQYTDSIFYSQIFALTLLFFPQKFIGTLFQAQAHTKALYISTTIAPIAKLVLAIALIPPFGIMGALFAELGARVLNLITLSVLFAQTSS